MEYTAQEIAQKMEISARTVEAIKDRLMERFGVKNSVGLVFYAMKNSFDRLDYQKTISGISPSIINLPAVLFLISSTLTPGALSNNLNPSSVTSSTAKFSNNFFYTLNSC